MHLFDVTGLTVQWSLEGHISQYIFGFDLASSSAQSRVKPFLKGAENQTKISAMFPFAKNLIPHLVANLHKLCARAVLPREKQAVVVDSKKYETSGGTPYTFKKKKPMKHLY